ncbi:MAG: ribonuclease E/G [Pseudomonadota bacterium]
MSGILIIESWAAETRAALINNDDVAKFWFGPAPSDETHDRSLRAGTVVNGRVRQINRALNAAFVEIGHETDGFLTLSDQPARALCEGEIAKFTIKTPPRGPKGATLRYLGEGLSNAPLGRCAPFDDPAIEAINAIGREVHQIFIDRAIPRQHLSDDIADAIQIDHRSHALFSDFGADDGLTAAFERRAPIPGGGALILDETEALTLIDVDTDGLQAASSLRLQEKIALAALKEAERQISLRGIGGQVVLDLPLSRTGGAKSRLSQTVKKAAAGIRDARAISLANNGLLSFAVPRRTLSLLEAHTEIAPVAPISGRRFTTAWLAKKALRHLELELRNAPSERFELSAGKPIYDYIEGRQRWIERMKDRYSARFRFVSRSSVGEQGHDIVKL